MNMEICRGDGVSVYYMTYTFSYGIVIHDTIYKYVCVFV